MNEQQEIASGAELTAEEKFKKALKKTNDSYLMIVIFCGALTIGGVFYAVIDSVMIGLLVSIAGVLLYTALTSNLLYNTLGISYKSATKQLTVTAFYGKNKEEAFIPQRLIWLDVTELYDHALKHKSSEKIRVLHLPSTLKVIGESVFEGCACLTTIIFDGSIADWGKVESLTDLSVYKIICNDGIIHARLPLDGDDSADDTSISDSDTESATSEEDDLK